MQTNLNYDHISQFLNELNTVEGGMIEKIVQPVFETSLDEARFEFIKEAKKQIELIHHGEGKPDKYGHQTTSWSVELPDHRYKVTFKSGGKTIQIAENKTYFVVANGEEACKFIAKAVVAAEQRQLDRFLVIERKVRKPTSAGGYISSVKKQWAKTEVGASHMDAAESGQD
jgi:hypothetical protein